MVVNNGDKLVAKKTVAEFLKEGDIAKVISVNDGIIQFAFGENFMHMGVMTSAECEKHFEKYVEKATAPTVTAEHVKSILDNSEIETFTIFDKCTVVACKLPNGFVIVESSACVSPENYDAALGEEICKDKIIDKIWMLEGYKLQNEVHKEKHENEKKDVNKGITLEDILNNIFGVADEEDCWMDDMNCDDCMDYTCEFNPENHRNIT